MEHAADSMPGTDLLALIGVTMVGGVLADRGPEQVETTDDSVLGVAPAIWVSAMEVWAGRIHVDDRTAVARAWHEAMVESSTRVVRYRYHHPDGDTLTVDDVFRISRAGRGGRRIDRALSAPRGADRTHLHTLLTSTVDPLAIKDARGRYLVVNRAFETMLGVAPGALQGRTAEEALPPPVARRVAAQDDEVRRRGAPVQTEERISLHAEDRILLVTRAPLFDHAGAVIGITVVTKDVTGRRRAEAAATAARDQFHHLQQVEALSSLASSAAHDLNNLLSVIMGAIDLTAATLEPTDPRRSDLDVALVACRRGGALAEHLLRIGRRIDPPHGPVDLVEVLSRIKPLLRQILNGHAALSVETEASLPPIPADEVAIEQVLLNLVVNARDAMAGPGRVTIRVSSSLEGRGVDLSVEDTGVGMSPEVLSRAFDPYFSTKGTRGTGLGLATVNSVVGRLGGRIAVTSVPGRGTTFCITLPTVAPG